MSRKSHKKASRSSIRWGVFGIFLMLLFAAGYGIPGAYNKVADAIESKVSFVMPRPEIPTYHLGLDLQGGAHLVYEIDVSSLPFSERADGVAGVRDVIERRVNAFGVGEPRVQTNVAGDKHRIIVELPGVVNVQDAIKQIGETPLLEFKEVNPNPATDLTAQEQKDLDEQNRIVRDKAKKALNTVLSDPEGFADHALALSEDAQTKERAGKLGTVGTSDYAITQDLFTFSQKNYRQGEVARELAETDLGFHVIKFDGTKEEELEVSARHVLICWRDLEGCQADRSKEEASALSAEVFRAATPETFSSLVAQYSDDAGTKEKGGDLGSFAGGVMVPAFNEKVFEMPLGQIDTVESSFGFHIIYKYDELSETQYDLSHIFIKKVQPYDVAPHLDGWMSTKLSGAQLDRASVQFDHQTGDVQVGLEFDGEGGDLFADITERNIGQQVAIFLDGSIISAPRVDQRISGGQAVIHGNFTLDEAKLLTQRLNAGALPLPVELVSQSTVGPTLGRVSLEKSLKAAMIGFALVLLFMIAYYRLLGIVAGVALVLYVGLVLAVFKWFPVTLTLAGVAGFILSLGMAVDANVLIFERIKEELKEGRSFGRAIGEGFERAWTSIRDGNVSTLITCAILYWFGTSIVRGFAVTLAVGVLLSMFSAITITRILVRYVEPVVKDGSPLILGNKKRS